MLVLSILRPRFSSLLLFCYNAYTRAQLLATNTMAFDFLPSLFVLCPASLRRALAAAHPDNPLVQVRGEPGTFSFFPFP